MKITTNNVPRDLLSACELPDGIMEREFDYIDDADKCGPRFFKYRGAWYDANEFVRIEKRSASRNGFAHTVDEGHPLLTWDGIQTDTHFSGVVIRYADRDCERVIVGSAYA